MAAAYTYPSRSSGGVLLRTWVSLQTPNQALQQTAGA